jgi:ribosomal protein S27E
MVTIKNRQFNYYKNPIDKKTGKPYYVPCVVKNRDTLIAYVWGIRTALQRFMELDEELGQVRIDTSIDSLRMNDVLPDGRRARDIPKIELQKMEDEVNARMNISHPDNVNVEPLQAFFNLTCSNCGNYYVFHEPEEIPSKNFKCGICGRVLIDYTKQDDWNWDEDSPVR